MQAGNDSADRPPPASLPRATPVVHICITTFRRPKGLGRLLESLANLRFGESGPPEARIVVVDNDAQQSASPVCEAARSRLPWSLSYVVEPSRGIAQARNAAVRSIMEQGDFIAFIDDDEVPDVWWLDELLRVQRASAADVVTGPVFPYFEGTVPAYVLQGRFFDPPVQATGTRLDRAYTGNVLARSRVFREMPVLFDERLGMTGGEDVHFFRRVARAGFIIVWAADAKIDEWVPPTRTSVAYILKRAFRTGTTIALCEREFTDSRLRRASLGFRALGTIAKAILGFPLSAIDGRHGLVQALRTVVLGLGYFAGAVGVRYEEYRTVHGS